MKKYLFMPAALFVVVGCNQSQSPAPISQVPTAAPLKLTATQELAKYCRVCVVDKNEKMEEFLPMRLDKNYQGQTYKFCSEPCRKSFDANPKKYQLSQKKGA